MKFVSLLVIGSLASSAIGLPATKVDIDIHIDLEETIHKFFGGGSGSTRSRDPPKAPPIVDLIYERHQALPDTKENQSYYKFANIPYAKQPIGDLRFKAAEALSEDVPKEKPLNKGEQDVVCPQEQVGWVPFAKEFTEDLFDAREGPIQSKWSKKITPNDYASMPTPNPLQNESCLVLDVYVPKRLYDNEQGIANVVVLFHGGGFIFGSKNIFGSPEGLLQQAAQFGEDSDIIFVSVNYRLGAFGWLAGDAFAEAGGYENAGLTDIQASLEWVRNYVQIFGGNQYDVTVLGESAGASSLLHLITAHGGSQRNQYKGPKFERAILQSPAFFPTTDRTRINNTYQDFLSAAKAKSFEELQKANTEDLIYANSKTTYESPYGIFKYGPVVSTKNGFADLVPAPPSLLFRTGLYHMNVRSLIIANNRREGALFTPPWIRTTAALREHILEVYPRMDKEDLDLVMTKYPVSDKSLNERYKFLQGAAVFGDLGVDCNVWSLRKAFPSYEVWQYYYRLYPGFHGQDVGATFWNYSQSDLTALNNEEQSQRLQRYLTSFVKFGTPNQEKLATDATWDSIDGAKDDKKYMYFGDGLPKLKPFKDLKYGMEKEDPLPSDDICDMWESAPYWGPDDSFVQRYLLQTQGGQQTEL